MNSVHLQQLIKLCERIPESDLIKLNRGLEAFFAKNPMSKSIQYEISGGLSWNEISAGLAISVAIGLFIWHTVNARKKKKMLAANIVFPGLHSEIKKGYGFDLSIQGPGIYNTFTVSELAPAPRGNYNNGNNHMLIKPWVLSKRYPNRAVFVYGDPNEWFRNTNVTTDEPGRFECVLPDLDTLSEGYKNKYINIYGMPAWYDNHHTAINFSRMELYKDQQDILTEDDWNDIIAKLNSVRRWIVNCPHLTYMAYMPLKSDPENRGSNLFLSAEYLYNYEENLNANSDRDWNYAISSLIAGWNNKSSWHTSNFMNKYSKSAELGLFNEVREIKDGVFRELPTGYHPPGIVNSFTINDLPELNDDRLKEAGIDPHAIAPWLLAEQYPNSAVFVRGDPTNWFPRTNTSQTYYMLGDDLSAPYRPNTYNYYKTALNFRILDTNTEISERQKIPGFNDQLSLITDGNFADVRAKLVSISKYLKDDFNLYSMVYMPKCDKYGPNLFISANFYDYAGSSNYPKTFADKLIQFNKSWRSIHRFALPQ